MDTEPSKVKETIHSVHLSNIHIDWSPTGCIVDFSMHEEKIARFSSNLRTYLNSLGLMKKFETDHRYDQETGAWLDITAFFSNDNFEDFENEVDEIRKAIHAKISEHYKGVGELSKLDPRSTTPEDLRQIRNLMACLDSMPTSSAEFSFKNTNSLFLEHTKKTVKKIVDDEGEPCEIVGKIMCCNDQALTATFYQIEKMRGYICLELESDEFRRDILEAQLGKERVRARYAPTKNLLNPGAGRSGILKSLERLGADDLF